MEVKFNKGFKEVREKMMKNSFRTRSCYNCDSYYQAVGDKEELCQDTSVLKYDMIVSENQICCTHWKPIGLTKEVKTGGK